MWRIFNLSCRLLLDVWAPCESVIEPDAEAFGCGFPLDFVAVDDDLL